MKDKHSVPYTHHFTFTHQGHGGKDKHTGRVLPGRTFLMNIPPTMPPRVPTFWRLLLLLELLLPLGFKNWVFILCLPVDVAGEGGEQ